METKQISLILFKAEELRNFPNQADIVNLKATVNYLFHQMKETDFDPRISKAFHNYRTEYLKEIF
jgi:hypothetical protein